MTAPMAEDNDIRRTFAAASVTISGEEAAMVAAQIARIRAAAAQSLHLLPFDLAIERFYQRLESHAAPGDAV